jgi:hypothetical protein
MMMRFLAAVAVCALLPSGLVAGERSLTAYFDNDSINPFRFVDAYETHSMGLEYRDGDHRFAIEAAIVSPDMIVYKNIYRVANRSYGELLRLRYARALEIADVDVELGGYVVAAGEFKLDRIQQLIHDVFWLQDTFGQVQPIRMPSDVWFGVTGEASGDLYSGSSYQQNYLVQFGSDRIALGAGVSRAIELWGWDGSASAGFDAVLRDEIISAPPISPEFRRIVPKAGLELSRRFGNATVTIGETISLPTIASDNRMRAVFDAALTWHFD